VCVLCVFVLQLFCSQATSRVMYKFSKSHLALLFTCETTVEMTFEKFCQSFMSFYCCTAACFGNGSSPLCSPMASTAGVLKCIAVCRSMLQCVAVCFTVSQCVAVCIISFYCFMAACLESSSSPLYSPRLSIASVLQCVAVYRSMFCIGLLLHGRVFWKWFLPVVFTYGFVRWCVAVCCSVL